MKEDTMMIRINKTQKAALFAVAAEQETSASALVRKMIAAIVKNAEEPK